jgi:hypothetical protein
MGSILSLAAGLRKYLMEKACRQCPRGTVALPQFAPRPVTFAAKYSVARMMANSCGTKPVVPGFMFMTRSAPAAVPRSARLLSPTSFLASVRRA